MTMPKWLAALIDEVRQEPPVGEVSQYLPELAAASDDDFGVSVRLSGGESYSIGTEHRFTVQSVIKVVTLLASIEEQGLEPTLQQVGCDHAEHPYNSVDNYIAEKRRTANPFVNAGALLNLDMLHADSADTLVERILGCSKQLTGNPYLAVNMHVAQSEYELSHRNRSIVHHMASFGAIQHDIDELLWAYCQICSIEVNVEDLANFAFHLSGVAPLTGDDLQIESDDLRMVQRLILATGMYGESAEYATRVGLPSKCGVSGSMIGIIPGVGGVGLYSPALNETGNCVRGMSLMQRLSQHFEVEKRHVIS